MSLMESDNGHQRELHCLQALRYEGCERKSSLHLGEPQGKQCPKGTENCSYGEGSIHKIGELTDN